MYAGWIVLNVRLFVFVLLISLFLSVSLITLFVRNRAWHEYVTFFVAIYSLSFAGILLLLSVLARQPVLSVEALFPFP